MDKGMTRRAFLYAPLVGGIVSALGYVAHQNRQIFLENDHTFQAEPTIFKVTLVSPYSGRETMLAVCRTGEDYLVGVQRVLGHFISYDVMWWDMKTKTDDLDYIVDGLELHFRQGARERYRRDVDYQSQGTLFDRADSGFKSRIETFRPIIEEICGFRLYEDPIEKFPFRQLYDKYGLPPPHMLKPIPVPIKPISDHGRARIA